MSRGRKEMLHQEAEGICDERERSRSHESSSRESSCEATEKHSVSVSPLSAHSGKKSGESKRRNGQRME